jgi:hypothetical protein
LPLDTNTTTERYYSNHLRNGQQKSSKRLIIVHFSTKLKYGA